MRKLITGSLLALMLGGGAGVALADHAGTNPTDPEAIGSHPALYGLCMAWHANETGRANGNAGNAGPFAALQAAADEAQDAQEGEGDISEFCDGIRPGNGHGNGGNSSAPNPNSHPGRG